MLAQNEYYVLSANINEVSTGLGQLIAESECGVWKDALQVFADGLSGYEWPADVQPKVDTQVAVTLDEVVFYDGCASPGNPDWNYGDELSRRAGEAATATRAALDLPVTRG